MASKKQIMCVDDEPFNLTILSEVFEDDYDLLLLSSGDECLEYLKDNDNPDLILLDNLMPGTNGLDVCRLLKTNEKTRAIPIYFLSALAMKEDIKKGIDAGADSYITKPFSVTALLNKVESLFNRDMQKPSILCVDDDPVMLQIFNYILKYQFKVSFVADGFEALEHIKMNTPELIITDQKMPGMDGFELITKIRAINDKAKIPCIIVTSLSRQELQPQLNDADPIHFLSKPICYDELLSIVNKLLLVA